MKTWRALPLVVCLLAGAVGAAIFFWEPASAPEKSRSVMPVKVAELPAPAVFSRAESTGLFVGVKTFEHDSQLEVPYAVDDAVDLAYKFSLDQRSSLVPPQRVVLALSGRPEKKDSQTRLDELKAAGARVENATAGDILQLLKKQAAEAGNGLLVLSLATHGFLAANGDAYILGSTSEMESTQTSLKTAPLFDIASKVGRSLVFVDACRSRAGESRGGASDRLTAAPLLTKMGGIQGQVIFYAAAAGQWAYDDPVRRNGVFTGAVLDGLDCGASAPRGEVVAETLHTYVERAVREWILKHKDKAVDPATQVSLEGRTASMPLRQCWRNPKFPIHAASDGSWIKAFDADTKPLWQQNLKERIVQTGAADLDADAYFEVIAGTAKQIAVFNRDGAELWRRSVDGMSLAALTTGDLFHKHTNQIVALWTRGRASRVTILDSAGNEVSSYDAPDFLQYVAVGRPTNRFNMRMALASAGNLVLFDATKLAKGKPIWRRLLASSNDEIRGLRMVDADNDSRPDIEVETKRGTTVFSFDGKIIRQNAEWRQ